MSTVMKSETKRWTVHKWALLTAAYFAELSLLYEQKGLFLFAKRASLMAKAEITLEEHDSSKMQEWGFKQAALG